jgi:ring-1,2-phenylacetyl-CoA epoxidase subunit PaaC
MDETESELVKAGVIPNLHDLKPRWMEQVLAVLNLATLNLPENQGFFGAGRQGRHSEHMGFLLAQLQYMQRAYPNMQW